MNENEPLEIYLRFLFNMASFDCPRGIYALEINDCDNKTSNLVDQKTPSNTGNIFLQLVAQQMLCCKLW